MSLSLRLAQRLQQAWREDDALAQALRPLAALHRVVQTLKVCVYRRRLKRSAALPVPVIVVGNWIVGGAGKTPTLLALLTHLRALGLRVGVVSRGYGRREDGGVHLVQPGDPAELCGDEPLLIRLRSGVPVAVGRDRVAAARLLLDRHPELQLLLSDDGLQHWRLPRQLSILVFDERGLGNGRLLPAGPLRQDRELPPPPGSAGTRLVLYNATAPSTPLPGHLARRELAGAVRLRDWCAGEPARLDALHALRGRPLLAAAGLAQPERFFAMLEQQGLTLERLPLADHATLQPLPWPREREVLVTEKDAVKLRHLAQDDPPIWVVALDFRPEHAFFEALQHCLRPLLSHGSTTD